MTTRTIARWRDWSGSDLQHAVINETAKHITVDAAIIATVDDERFAMTLAIICDESWRVREVRAAVVGDDRGLHLTSDGEGHWRDANGKPLAVAAGAIDIDLPVTPFTNTLPIRRLNLKKGASADIRTVYITPPNFEIISDPQRYTCIEPLRRYRYESLDSDFVAEIDVDADGLVVTYPDLFKRVP
jgi:uncharacterized protein